MMNYCSNCGNKLTLDNIYCPYCGIKIKIENNDFESKVVFHERKEGIVKEQNKINVFAIIGFIISIFSVITFGFSSFLSLIFSIIGLIESKKKSGNGKGLSVAGIIISVIALILLIFMLFLLFFEPINSTSVPNTHFDGPIY